MFNDHTKIKELETTNYDTTVEGESEIAINMLHVVVK